MLVEVVWLTYAVIDDHLAFITNHDESLTERHDLLDIEALSRLLSQRFPQLAIVLTQDDLALISANQDAALWQPAVRCVVLTDVAVLFLCDLTHLGRQNLVLLDEVFVGLVASDEHNVGVSVAKRDLCAKWMSRVMTHSLMREAAQLVHLPNVDVLIRLRTERDEQFLILGAEGHRNEALVLLDVC